ncbi:MAG: adenylate kinase [Planctomycetes bacterium]|nr:adenylate kinase [Planctomycetota bacterium]
MARAQIVVLLGPPGAGKGTQAKRLAKQGKFLHLATGDLLRSAVARGTELGKVVRPIMEAGGLVSDELVMGLLKEAMAEVGGAKDAQRVIFDGMPRTLPQAAMLDELLAESGRTIDRVVLINTADNVLVDRVAQRRSCVVCGAVYNLKAKPPQVPGHCDACNGELIQRPDDRRETVLARLRKYWQDTAPLIDLFRGRGLLVEVPGNGSMDEVAAGVMAAVDGKPAPKAAKAAKAAPSAQPAGRKGQARAKAKRSPSRKKPARRAPAKKGRKAARMRKKKAAPCGGNRAKAGRKKRRS